MAVVNTLRVKLPSPPSGPAASSVLDKDKDTPDSHVARDGRLIRLTGVHPFNAEAPLTALYDEGEITSRHESSCRLATYFFLGFLTSVDLFYVRNHGPVPQVLDDDVLPWEISVEGCV